MAGKLATAVEIPYPPAREFRADARLTLRSALIAGVVAAGLSSIPLRPALVFALPIGGFLAVLLYRRQSPAREEPSLGVGFRLGVLSGLVAFVTFAFEALVLGGRSEFEDALLKAVRQAQARSADAQAREAMEYFLTPQGLVWMIILGLVFMAIIFVLLSGLGGAVSAALLRRKAPPER
jgi:hypothetical protein